MTEILSAVLRGSLYINLGLLPVHVPSACIRPAGIHVHVYMTCVSITGKHVSMVHVIAAIELTSSECVNTAPCT